MVLREGSGACLSALAPYLPQFCFMLSSRFTCSLRARSTRFGNHIAGLFFESSDQSGRVVFAELWPTEILEATPPSEECYWLPPSLRAWYRLTDGFQWGDLLTGRRGTNEDFPSCFSGRFSVEQYCDWQRAKRSEARVLYRRIGSRHVEGWFCPSKSEAVFVDTASRDGLLYHVRASDFDTVAVIDSPERRMDRYLAALLEGEADGSFNFLVGPES